MTIANIKLKGLSSEQISSLLPEGLISLCWRGSVAHGMYVPKSDPNSIDDKDLMGIYIGPLEHTSASAGRMYTKSGKGSGTRRNGYS